ncbi:nucleotide sugar dehydrogenase [Fusobacterium animalis]|uniref:nucleotide sugar dehydrogenase n=1 Tax=Fusobacterium animalis TaxID=76859 RepID=UPI0030D0ABB9
MGQISIYNNLKERKAKLALIGLGYVGLPIAIAFSKKGFEVVGFDLNNEKVELYKNGVDPTFEVGDNEIKKNKIYYTSNEEDLRDVDFYIVAVPTPVTADKVPDLTPVKSASHIIGRNLKKNSIIVYESTVYPGVTEDICLPILESESNLKAGIDFKIGYSPERISPGDNKHKLENIVKIVSGMDEETLEEVAKVYGEVIEIGLHKAPSIKVAEAAKVIENSQRDINIAFMNELSIIFNKMNINTKDVLEAASTKWNFLPFQPGLVGGHCIGVDPYYLTYKAEEIGYHSQVILAGRKINDDMGKYVAENIVKKLLEAEINVLNARIGVLGCTFKEDCPDVRNSKVFDIINELKSYNIKCLITDPIADKKEVKKVYGYELVDIEEIKDMDLIVIPVSHKEYKELDKETLFNLFNKMNKKKIIFDIKSIFNKKFVNDKDIMYWSL